MSHKATLWRFRITTAVKTISNFRPMKNLKMLLALTLLFVSCAGEATIENGDIETLFKKERTLTLTSQVPISEMLGACSIVDILGDYAILQMRKTSADFAFYVIDINTGKVVNKLFSVGRGRNELQYPTYLGSCDGQIHIYDQINKLIISLDVDQLLTNSSATRPQRVKCPQPEKPYFAATYMTLSDNRYVLRRSIGFFNDEDKNTIQEVELIALQLEEDQLSEGEPFTIFGQGESDDTKHYTYLGSLCTTDDSRHMLYTTTAGAYLQFYDCSQVDAPPTMIKEYVAQMPKYQPETKNSGDQQIILIKNAPETLSGINFVTADDDNYYMGYIGRTKDECFELSDEEMESCTITILVFDKKGEPKEKLKIEQTNLFKAYEHSSTNNSLYTIGYDDDGNDCLMQYKL